jgi:cytochrome c oxidase subunit 2
MFLLAQPESIEIVCTRSYFTPNQIRVQSGKPVRFILKSDDVTHGFAIDEYKIAKEVPPGPPTKLEFTPDRPGTYEFYCVVRCGKEHLKMRGTLIVE